jgi:hypothetical protein
MAKRKGAKAKKVRVEVGANVIVLTGSYHWTGRLIENRRVDLVLDDAMVFVEIGQIESAIRGEFVGAHGDPIPSGHLTEVPGPLAGGQIIPMSGPLPRKQLKG